MEKARSLQQSGFHLHNSFGFWISRLSNLMKEEFNQQLEAYDVTWPQWMTLNVLHHQLARTPAQIADNIGVDRSAVTRLLDRLEAKGFIERVHEGLDRRSVTIFMTKAGEQLIEQLNSAAAEHQTRFLSELHPTELRAFKGNIQKLLRAGGVETLNLWKHV
ncbi:MarR family winged helix-turn-helix transcriptional regulator [Marinimicrobium alkaliphilum]|uniref:MarR family winged helix-turn-helix transcriptional regulator n=1 Tax=Marinimicrobium alkaliphilum TaxID=2202654 RepID=UPI001300BCDD|nr:MarR family transcriptional regulator [Marinimicrobium alkaliphilum]